MDLCDERAGADGGPAAKRPTAVLHPATPWLFMARPGVTRIDYLGRDDPPACALLPDYPHDHRLTRNEVRSLCSQVGIPVEGSSAPAQPLGCGGHVATRGVQHADDVAALHFSERQALLVGRRGRRLAEVEVLGQVVDVYRLPRREYQEPFDRVRELTNVP